MNLDRYVERIQTIQTMQWTGQVTQLTGLLIESKGPAAANWGLLRIATSRARTIRTQLIGFRDGRVLSMPLEETDGLESSADWRRTS
jgi:flagellum-specific ATP synthase